MLTEFLRKYFQELKEIGKAVDKDLDDTVKSKERQSIITNTTYIINNEIEKLCLTYNPSELIDEFVEIIRSTNFPRKTVNSGEVFLSSKTREKNNKWGS